MQFELWELAQQLYEGFSAHERTASVYSTGIIILARGGGGGQAVSARLAALLDEMAASGIRFTRFYSVGPVCSPKRQGTFIRAPGVNL